jgi:hypothetical protein
MPKRPRRHQQKNKRPGVPPHIVPCAPDATAGMVVARPLANARVLSSRRAISAF